MVKSGDTYLMVAVVAVVTVQCMRGIGQRNFKNCDYKSHCCENFPSPTTKVDDNGAQVSSTRDSCKPHH